MAWWSARVFTLCMIVLQSSLAHADDLTDAASAAAKAAIARSTQWTGPTKGPKAAPDKFIVYIASDMANGGVATVAKGVAEAAATIGWRLKVFDGAGTVAGRSHALDAAMSEKPDAIVIGGFDVSEDAKVFESAGKAGIPLVGWHSGVQVGPEPAQGIFANIGTSPKAVAQTAADLAIADSGGKAGVVILTDSNFDIAVYKARAMEAVIRTCSGCKVLEFIDTPISDVAKDMPALTKSLLDRYGDKWTYTLAINDNYFDFMGPTLTAAGKQPNGIPKAISAGDGSTNAYERIRSHQFQMASVPEPLNMQGWQVVDEINRAFAKMPWSGFIPIVHLVTADNIAFDGGVNNLYDPDNQYRDHYKAIWGK
ncbi:MAG: substrate-binding domain-containing protein [Hyphomicrobiales bacterium]|nr:substrate-binding domain-containing protein [Hyphomicrobiales bacterium]MDE2113725.1 substrate-binding domain-containing protein [Hyphomicrobiales bacterium]